ncbi:MAG: heme-binding domain-containing protein [Ignavibacteria bacterium]|nr:heme-binding domain-containing protein [Ignavibacteria bacterium]
MKKVLKFSVVVIIIAFIGIQFINRPVKITTTEIMPGHITKVMSVPSNVENILKRSCYDCHSDHTVWPWYSNVAPVSWLVADDVIRGRKKMNFSQWDKISASKREARLNEICEQVNSGEMPLEKYLYIHTDAKLSQADKDILCQWIEIELKKLEEDDEDN